MHKVKRPRDRVFFQLLIYNDDAGDHVVNDDAGYVADDDADDVVNDGAADVVNDDAADHDVNDDAGYVADDDGRNRFISTTTVGPRAFKLSSGLPALVPAPTRKSSRSS